MPDDPLLSYYGQPILPAGFNSAPNDGDEVDGAGYNEPVWPYLFNSFIPLEVLIVTPEMMEVFDGCPDFIALCVPDEIVIPAEQLVYTPPPAPPVYTPAMADATYVVNSEINVIVFPAEQTTLVITEEAA